MKPTTFCILSFNDVKCTKFLFFYVFNFDLKEKYHIRRTINCKKNKTNKNLYVK